MTTAAEGSTAPEGDTQAVRPGRIAGIPGDPYASLADSFLSHYSTLRGEVRYRLVARQVDAHLDPGTGRVVDVGGGAGHQAIRLARLGHDVTVVDPSREMLRRAREALEHEDPAVRDRVRLLLGRGEDAHALLAPERFDAVLCHGVLPFLSGPAEMVAALAALARPGAVVSIVAKNASALAMRAGLEGRFEDALRAFGADRDRGGLGVVTRGDTVESLAQVLQANGVELVRWYGLRVFTDHMWDRPTGPDVDEAVEAEWEAGRRDPYRQVARLLHVIGRRT